MHTDEIAVINDRHARSVDVIFMREYGMYSKLLGYESRVLRLEIYVSATWKLKPEDTGRFYALLYRRAHPELEKALGFDARLIYETDPTDEATRQTEAAIMRRNQIRKFKFYNKHDPEIANMPDDQIMALMAFGRMLAPDSIKEKLRGERVYGFIDN